MAEQFLQPRSVTEACEILADHPEGVIVAGGQSLTPLLRAGLMDPDTFIDVSRIDDFKGITVTDGELRIRAGTTWARLHESDVLAEHAPAVRELSGQIGDLQVRNRGTIGGSLSHADPATDMGALLLCFDCEVVCRSRDGQRTIPIEEFFVGMFETPMRADELLTDVRITPLDAPGGSHYEKFEIRQGGFSTVGVGTTVEFSADGETFETVRVGLANCGDTPLLVPGTTDLAAGEPVDGSDVVEAVGDRVKAAADPVNDEYATAEYKERVARNLAIKSINRIIEQQR